MSAFLRILLDNFSYKSSLMAILSFLSHFSWGSELKLRRRITSFSPWTHWYNNAITNSLVIVGSITIRNYTVLSCVYTTNSTTISDTFSRSPAINFLAYAISAHARVSSYSVQILRLELGHSVDLEALSVTWQGSFSVTVIVVASFQLSCINWHVLKSGGVGSTGHVLWYKLEWCCATSKNQVPCSYNWTNHPCINTTYSGLWEFCFVWMQSFE